MAFYAKECSVAEFDVKGNRKVVFNELAQEQV
jgi:hypothetical protein